MTRKRKQPTGAQLRRLHALVRSYCERERADVPVDDPRMVRAWHAICRAVGVRP